MIVIALGANLSSPAGPPAATLREALHALEAAGVRALRVSSFYRTPAWPDPSDSPFVNAVAVVRTGFTPERLLAVLHEVEAAFGRVRSTPNAPRPLDLDLIDYDGRVAAGPPVLPHPRAAERAFVLVPLVEIAPDRVIGGRSVTAALSKLSRDGIERLPDPL